MTDWTRQIEQARQAFEDAKRAEAVERFDRALESFEEAATLAAQVWANPAAEPPTRATAARLTADASWSAGMSATLGQHLPAEDTLRRAILRCLELFDREELEVDVRLHGLYRAQCAAFELAHVQAVSDPIDAVALFRDAAGCADALATLALADAADNAKAARVLANAAASHLNLAGLLRQLEDTSAREHLEAAGRVGKQAVETAALPGPLEAETMLVLADASYELGLGTEDRKAATAAFEDALGWSRMASEAPGADGNLQAEALLRGANVACVYGLTLRHDDWSAAMEALDGAIALAQAAAANDHMPVEFRARSLDTAVRTQQNAGLLRKEKAELTPALEAFHRAAALALTSADLPNLPPPQRGAFLYLASNATLEAAIVQQTLAGTERHAAALQGLTRVQDLARAALGCAHLQPDLAARAALLACGASGRILRALDTDDARAIQTELEYIEAFGQRAAQTDGADRELRARGAFFAVDAAERLAAFLKDTPAAAEARHRVAQLHALHNSLK
jgi:hypothetical protein